LQAHRAHIELVTAKVERSLLQDTTADLVRRVMWNERSWLLRCLGAVRQIASQPIYLPVLFQEALLPRSFPPVQVTFLHGLHLVDTPRALDEAHRLLKPHGKLVAAWNDRCGLA